MKSLSTCIRLYLLGISLVGQAETLIQVPPSPNTNINKFEKQFVLFNSNRLFDKYSQSDPDVRHAINQSRVVEALLKDTSVTQGDKHFSVKQGITLNKGIAYVSFETSHGTLKNSIDVLNSEYQSNYNINHMNYFYKKPLRNNSTILGVDYSLSW